MIKKSVVFWILFISSLFIATLIISFVFKIMKATIFLALLVVIAPILYYFLKNLLASSKTPDRSEKLKHRD